MAILPLNRKREKVLNDFAREYKTRTLTFLNQYFHLCKEDCEDVFQEASITLYLKATEGELDDLTSSLYTYFIGICKNKAFEQVRKTERTFPFRLMKLMRTERATKHLWRKQTGYCR